MSNAPCPGPLAHVSASQVEVAERCERRWFLEKREKLAPLPTPAMCLGTDTHKAIEKHTKGEHDLRARVASGAASWPEKLAAGALRWMPGRELIHASELRIDLEVAGVPWLGFIDLVTIGPPPGFDPGLGAGPWNDLGVLDFKTTSARKWAKTPADLAKTVQMLAYARAVMSLDGAPVPVRHVYLLTKGATAGTEAGSFAVDTAISALTLAERWPRVEETVVRMRQLAEGGEREAAKKNQLACGDYGGCPHKNRCWGSQPDGKGDRMSLMLDKIAAKNAEAKRAAGLPSGAAAPPAPHPQVLDGECSCGAVVPLTKDRLLAEHPRAIDGKTCRGSGKAPLPPEPVTHAAAAAVARAAVPPPEPTPPAPVNPSLQVPGAVPCVQCAGAPALSDGELCAGCLDKPGQVVPPDAQEPLAAGEAPPPPRKRGRPSKAELAARAAEAAGTPNPSAPLPRTLPAEVGAAIDAADAARDAAIVAEADRQVPPGAFLGGGAPVGLVLLIGCIPSQGFATAEPLEPYIATKAAEVAAFLEVPHYRTGKGDFGKGGAFLEAAILAEPPPAGIYTITTKGAAVDAALAALVPIASVVIRGC